MKKYIISIVSTIFIWQVVACTSGNDNSTSVDSTQAGAVSDSIQVGSVIDSMPVVNTPITDSSGIIKTPPVNDDNVINPDSIKK